MTPERFWELVGSLEGVADDESCARLGALLRTTGEEAEFAEALDEVVDTLVAECRWPRDIRGSDTASWVAAAVVAGGRASYDAARSAGVIDPDEWEWGEAEALLVVGPEPTDEHRASGPPPDHGEAAPPVDITLQWFAVPSPPGVSTPSDRMTTMPVIDFGDDPSWGRVPVHDPEWVEAQRRLSADPSFVERRRALEGLHLWLTVRPATPEGEEAPDPARHSPLSDGYRSVREAVAHRVDTHEGPGVVLVVPVSDVLDGESRVDGYVRAAHRLLDAAGA